MASNKIIYGIDLGTTNSAIAKFENGKAIVKKSPFQGDVTPSCVYITPKAKVVVGQKAYVQLSKDLCLAFTRPGYQRNTFIEFKRIMGTTEKVYSANIEKNGKDPNVSPEELSAEVLKTLRSYINDEDVKEVVITVPAHFNDNQKNATKAAAKLAGFDHFELIQEPIAASVAYGLGSKIKNAYWLVFDLGGGTFDVALMKIEDGIMRAVDTAGNNHLGGKDIDNAIVEQIIIPYLKENFAIDECLKNKAFKGMWKPVAEDAKIKLSYNDTNTLDIDLGEYGCDDNGTEFEFAIPVSQSDLETVERPIFQQAIDIVNNLLERNHLTGEQLGALILVGGPTHSPVLRRMLKEQVSPNVDTSIDPMTAVACGAALYASTIDVPGEIVDARRDPSKIQLEVGVKSTSVEDVEYAAVRFLKGKSENYTEESVFVDFVRNDGEFSTGKVQVSEEGEAVELKLKHDCTNVYTIVCYDSKGNKLDCEPNYISIIHGIDGIGDAVLPLPYGFGSVDKNNNVVFTLFEGLKKSMRLPAVGKNGVKLYTDRQLRPGMSSDIIKIPILQATQDIDQLSRNQQKLKMIYCTHIYDVIITGDNVPSLLPAGSEINLTAHADRSGGIEKFTVDIPYLDITLDLTPKMQDVRLSDEKYGSIYTSEITDAKKKAAELKNDELTRKLNDASERFNNATDRDSKDKAFEQLQDVISQIDAEYSLGDWGRMERKLRNMYNELEEDNRTYGNDKTTAQVKQLKEDVDRVIAAQDMEAAKKLYDQLLDLDWTIAEIEFHVSWIRMWNRQFEGKKWSNVARARSLVNQGLEIINKGNPTIEELRPITNELWNMLPRTERPQYEGLLRQR